MQMTQKPTKKPTKRTTKKTTKKPMIGKGRKNTKWLNREQELFCQCYVSIDREMFGNGVQSYIEAYDPDQSAKNWYKTVYSAASRLLNNVKVIDRINELLEEGWLNDVNVDKQLSFLITQHDDKSSKLNAIKEYNRLKTRILEKEAAIIIKVDLTQLSTKELEDRRKTYLN